MTAHIRKGTRTNKPLSIPEIDQLLDELNARTDFQELWSKYEEETNLAVKTLEMKKKISSASAQMSVLFQSIRNTEVIPLEEIEQDIIPIIRQAAELPHIFYLYDEMQQRDIYTYRHNICVGIIAACIGKWSGLPARQLEELTLAATLHDVGKMLVPEEILQKPGKLTQAEYEEMKKHTIYGYELIKKIPILPPAAALTALQHHERQNGEGYPLNLQGPNIHLYARITAVADIFHAMSSNRVYHEAVPFYKVIRQMQGDVFGRLDPEIMFIFLNKMMQSLIGKEVILSSGHKGTILMVDPYEPLNALIKTEEEIIDLRYHSRLGIEQVLG